MKKLFTALFILALSFLFSSAFADLSTNLQVQTEIDPGNKRIVTQTFTDTFGNPTFADDKGYVSVRYTYGNREFHVIKTEYLDVDGNLICNNDGYAIIACVYSGNDVASISYLDTEGNLVNGPEGFAKRESKYLNQKHVNTWEYDADGNPVNLHRITEFNDPDRNLETSDGWYDTEGNPAAGPDGYARVEYEYRNSKIRKITYYDTDGELFYNTKEGYAVKEYSFRGMRYTELNYLGTDGELTAGPDGYARAVYDYINGDGRNQRTMYYNADGSLFFTPAGYCGIQRLTTSRNWVTDESYFCGEDQRGYCVDGYSRVTKEYTTNGKVSIQAYYDDKDQLMFVEKAGCAMLKNAYNLGNLVRTEYYNENKEPMPGPEGAFAVEYKYDNHLLTEKNYYDTDGKTPVNTIDGYAKVSCESNKDGKPLWEKYFDADGNQLILRDNADEIRYEWDGKNKISESYWQDNQPVNSEKGYHEIQSKYTAANKVSEQVFLDTAGNIVSTEEGYARIKTEYNSQGKVMATLYYDVYGSLMQTPNKEYAYVRTISAEDKEILNRTGIISQNEPAEPDEENPGTTDNAAPDQVEKKTRESTVSGLVYVEYYGTDGRLMNLPEGYATIARTLNEAGKTVGEAYFDQNEQKVLLPDGYHSYRQEIGEDGNPAWIAWYGLDDEPVINTKMKCHRVERTYLDAKHFTSEAWFDTEGNPMTTGDTYCRIEREFDELGNTTRERTYDANGEKIAREAGYDELRQEFNEENRARRIEYFLNDEPVLLENGYAALEREYDEAGNITVEKYFNTNGQPTAHTKGYGVIRREYNESKKVTYEAWYDTADQPMPINGTAYYAVGRDYDGSGNKILERYFDADGQKMLLPDGYHCYRQAIGEDGNPAWIAYYGLDDEPVINTKLNCHRVERTYLDAKHITSEAWFDTNWKPMAAGDTYCRIEREFDEHGNTVCERTYDENGKRIAREAGYDELRQEFNEENRARRIEYFLNGEPVLLESGYAAMEREYDEAGNVTVERYFDADGQPTAHSKGYGVIRREYNEKKKVTYEAWFDTADQPMPISGSVYHAVRREYDETGNKVLERYFDTNGQKMLLPDGYHCFRQAIGEDGNPSWIAYFGLDDEPVINTKLKCHRVDRTYLDAKHFTSEAWFDTEGNPMTTGDTYCRVEREFDERGNKICERTYDASGAKIAREAGYDELRQEFNEENRAKRIEYFLNGEPILLENGYAALEREYDEAGNVTYEKYFGTDGQPIAHTKGYGAIRREFNENKKVIFEAWYDTADQPMPINGNAYYAVGREYDEVGNMVLERYFDANGQKMLLPDGYHCYRREIGEDGNPAWIAYYGLDDEPVINAKLKCHRVERTYLDAKHFTSEAWFDTESNPMTTGDTYCRIEREFDDRGNTVCERTYDANGEKIARGAGYDELRQEFNEENRAKRIEYFLNGEPFLLENGYAALEREYDEAGNVTVERYFDTDGQPTAHTKGYGVIRREYNEQKKVTYEAWFDTADQPMPINGTVYYEVRREYDGTENKILERYFDADGQKMLLPDGYHSYRQAIGEDGNPAWIAYYGLDDEPVINTKMKCHRVERTYLDAKHITSEAWFDTNWKPMTTGDTYCRIEREFDAAGNTICERTYDSDRKKIAREAGYDELRQEFNEENRAIRIEYFLNGEPILLENGYAALEREYDESGNVTYEKYFDTEGQPTEHTKGYGAIRRKYNEKKKVIHEAWYDTADQPMPIGGNTYYAVGREYDEAGNISLEKYFDEQDNLTLCKKGYAMVRREYDSDKRIVCEKFFGIDGNPMELADGAACYRYTYNEAGEKSAPIKYDQEDHEIPEETPEPTKDPDDAVGSLSRYTA